MNADDIRNLSRADTCIPSQFKSRLPYEEEQYNIIKENISNISITFQIGDLITADVEGNYDFIYLSNVVDYMSVEDEIYMLNRLVNELSDKGIMAMFHCGGNLPINDKDYYERNERDYYTHKEIDIKDFALHNPSELVHTFTKRLK